MKLQRDEMGTIVFGKLVRPLKRVTDKTDLPFQLEIATIECVKSPGVMRTKMAKRGGL